MRRMGARVWGSQPSTARPFLPQAAQVRTWPRSFLRITKTSPQEQGTAWLPAGTSTAGLDREAWRETLVTRVRPFLPDPKGSEPSEGWGRSSGGASGGGFVSRVRSFSPRCTIGLVGTMIADFSLDPLSILKTT